LVEQGVEEILLPKFEYYLDESDPDVVLLRRQDDSFVAAFSAEGVTKEGIIEAAKEDYRTLLEAHRGSLPLATEQEQKRLSPVGRCHSSNCLEEWSSRKSA
jgi:hypothetical protein